MRITLMVSILCLFCVVSIDAQSTDRFIRILGNAQQVLTSNKAKLKYAVNEVAPNEYKKISYKSFDTAYGEFVESMKTIGVSERDIVSDKSSLAKYSKTVTKNYAVMIDDLSILDKLNVTQSDGYKMSSLEYLYDGVDQDVEMSLSLAALNDAKEKAKRICESIGMQVGKVLNIEAKQNCCENIKAQSAPTTTAKYSVTVTYELLD